MVLGLRGRLKLLESLRISFSNCLNVGPLKQENLATVGERVLPHPRCCQLMQHNVCYSTACDEDETRALGRKGAQGGLSRARV